jgi:hypothetical protein
MKDTKHNCLFIFVTCDHVVISNGRIIYHVLVFEDYDIKAREENSKKRKEQTTFRVLFYIRWSVGVISEITRLVLMKSGIVDLHEKTSNHFFRVCTK